MKLFFIFVLFLVCAGDRCSDYRGDVAIKKNGEAVSMIQLIANPDSFDDRHVIVSGFLVLRDEYENSLFLDKNAYEAGLYGNSIAVDFSHDYDGEKKFPERFDREYVSVSGVFRAGGSVFSVGTMDIVYSISSLSLD